MNADQMFKLVYRKTFHLVDKVAARPIGAVASHPIFLARLGLVLRRVHHCGGRETVHITPAEKLTI